MSYRICTTHWYCHGNHLHNYTYTRRPTGASQPAACREERLAFLLLHHGEGDQMTDLHSWATTHSILVPCLKLARANRRGLCSQTCEWLAKWAKACTPRTTYTSLTLASTLETVHVALNWVPHLYAGRRGGGTLLSQELSIHSTQFCHKSLFCTEAHQTPPLSAGTEDAPSHCTWKIDHAFYVTMVIHFILIGHQHVIKSIYFKFTLEVW